MKKKVYICIAFVLLSIPELFMIVALFAPLYMKQETPWEMLVLYYVGMLGCIAWILWKQTKMPLMVIEYADRLEERYMGGEREVVMFSDLDYIEYPIWLEKGMDHTRSMRFVLRDGNDVIIPDGFMSLKNFCKRWPEIKAGLDADGGNSLDKGNYVRGVNDFVMKPRLLSNTGFYLMIGAVAIFALCIARIVAEPGAMMAYIILPIAVFWYHSMALPFTSFRKDGDKLIVVNRLALGSVTEYDLQRVVLIAVQDYMVTIKTDDGSTSCYPHKLTNSQKSELKALVAAMGISGGEC